MRRKYRLMKYYHYQDEVRSICHKMNFSLPVCGWALYFHIPIPIRYKNWKKKMLHGQFKLSKPDIDNYEKAFFDSMRIADERIAQLSGHGKFWFNPDLVEKELRGGYIEILLNTPLHNPYNVEFIDQSVIDKRTPREWKRKKPAPTYSRQPKPLKLLPQELFKKEDKIK